MHWWLGSELHLSWVLQPKTRGKRERGCGWAFIRWHVPQTQHYWTPWQSQISTMRSASQHTRFYVVTDLQDSYYYSCILLATISEAGIWVNLLWLGQIMMMQQEDIIASYWQSFNVPMIQKLNEYWPLFLYPEPTENK